MRAQDTGGPDADGDRLVEEAYRGGGDALGQLYRAYAIRLFRFCCSRGLSDADAEDVCHDAILKAFRSLDRFRFGEPMWPWLAAIASNTCTDFLRREARSLAMAAVPDRQDDETPELHMERRESAQLVESALSNIPPQYASILYLREYERRPYAEIGSILGLSLASVRTRLLRARREFRGEILRLLEGSPAALPVLVWWSGFRLRLPSMRWKARRLEPHFASLAFALVVLAVPSGHPPTPAPEAAIATVSEIRAADFGAPAAAGSPTLTTRDATGSRRKSIPSPASSAIRTTSLTTKVPVADPTDGSQVRFEVGPAEVWCPAFGSSSTVGQTCSLLASVSPPGHHP